MADARKLTNWIWGLVSALLLVVVAAHAMAPVAQDHGQRRGSAFSASTAEVSLKSGARALVAKDIVRIEPQGPVPQVPAPVLVVVARPAQAVLRDFSAIVPRLAGAVLGPINPRAPPTA